MNEHTNQTGYLENEIAELSRQIEEKRRQLEVENGIVSDRELVSEVVAEQLGDVSSDEPEAIPSDTAPVINLNPVQDNQIASDDSYLHNLDDQSVASVNALIALVPDKGIKYALNEAKKQSPFILDAFHDALVDRLYEELKARGLVA